MKKSLEAGLWIWKDWIRIHKPCSARCEEKIWLNTRGPEIFCKSCKYANTCNSPLQLGVLTGLSIEHKLTMLSTRLNLLLLTDRILIVTPWLICLSKDTNFSICRLRSAKFKFDKYQSHASVTQRPNRIFLLLITQLKVM